MDAEPGSPGDTPRDQEETATEAGTDSIHAHARNSSVSPDTAHRSSPTAQPNLTTEDRIEEGVVIRSPGSWYEVQVGSDIIRAQIRGKFRLNERLSTNPIAVGDRVTLRVHASQASDSQELALIIDIHDRTNKLARRAAGRRPGVEHVIVANVDFAWAVQSILLPKLNAGFIDRFIVMAEYHGIRSGLIFNKADLISDSIRDAVESYRDLYRSLGYTVLFTSTKTGEGIDELREVLTGQTTVLTGPSGVGKSSLINAIQPGLNVRTDEVSTKTKKGRHITSNASLYPLNDGGFLIDTPGLREFGIVDVAPEEVGHYFVEFRPFLDECHFPNCTHDHEPGCAVITAVESGQVDGERWLSYINILNSVRSGDGDVGR